MLTTVALLAGWCATAAVTMVLLEVDRRSWLSRRRARRVLVHTTDNTTIGGLLRRVTRDGLVLAAARLVDEGVDVAGEVWVPRPRVLMIQHLEES
jgi:hypothetical protein